MVARPKTTRSIPNRGWQRSEHCPQSFVPRITRQHVWGGTPGHHGVRSGSLSPYSILLHRPSEVLQEYACSLPGRKRLEAGAERTLEGVACTRLFGADVARGYGWRRISAAIPSPVWRRRIISSDNGRFRLSTSATRARLPR